MEAPMVRKQLGPVISMVLLALWSAEATPALAQSARSMTLVDLLNVPQLSDPQLSPDGRAVLYVLAEADWKENKRIGHIWRGLAEGGAEPVKMTAGKEGERSPRWSPEGQTIAFLARREAAGSGQAREGSDREPPTQIFLLRADGGEAQPLTSHETSISEFAWAPDGRTIYFLAEDPKTAEEKQRDKVRDDVYAFDERFEHRHLWKVSVPGGEEQRLTGGEYSILDFALAPDGRRMAIHRAPSPLFGDAEKGEVWVMDATGENARQLTKNDVPEENAVLSPDGSQVLFLAGANAAFETYYNSRIFLVPAGGGPARVLTPDLPYEVERAAWSRDGSTIYFTANTGVESQLFRVPAAGGRPVPLTQGQHSIRGWMYEPRAARHLLSLDQPSNAGDLWMLPADGGGEPARVTKVFDRLAREYRLPKQERVEWKGADGVTVEGLLFYPLEYRNGQRYPLVVQTHGGPQASDKFGFGRWGSYVQVLTAMGYAVLQPNYRGSTGYGDAFLRDMVGSYFKNSHLDVMTGVDDLIKRGIADPDRLVKMGWSGGGHMTNKIITFTDRFKAASSGAGAANWVSMYAQSDVRTYRTPWFGGTPWQANAPIDVYWEHSPLKYASRVKTPTIFLVGERDVRVPMPQSVEMYRALKSNGVPTKLYVAPREPHGWQELRHELFKMNVELDWFEKHARGRSYTWEKAPETPGAKASPPTP
jgi:dipeptidyl aminopeptidase/acylaminoacyl peptidase